MTREKYPFDNLTVPAAQKNKRALSNDDIKTLIEYKTDKPEEQKAIDFWTFSYLGNGLNFKDLAMLRYLNIQGDHLKFYRSKTKKTNKGEQKEISIHILARMNEIIKRWGNNSDTGKEYLFPILHEGMSGREQLWNEIKNEMCNEKNIKNWLFNYSTVKYRPADLGYYIDNKIAKEYFDNAADKKQAVIDIIEMKDPIKFLQISKYD